MLDFPCDVPSSRLMGNATAITFLELVHKRNNILAVSVVENENTPSMFQKLALK